MNRKQAYISLILALSVCGVAVSYAQQAAQPAAAATPPAATSPAATTAKAGASSGTIAVNGVAIPKSRIDMLVKAQAAQGRPESPEMVAAVKDQLVLLELVSQEAAKKGLEKNPDVATRIAMGKQQVLADAYVQDYVKNNPVSDEQLKGEYEKFKGQLGDKEYKPSHILVEKEDEAKAIIEELKKGGDFGKIAKEKSKDTGSKENNGDLDWGPSARFVQPFADALKTLQKGQFTQTPVQTNFGYHIIKMDDIRDLKAPSFDEVKDNFRQRVQQQQVQKMLADLKGKAKIVDK